MKNKLRIYMLVASLFMCCGVIGFGIYAATLGLTVSGALGYNGADNIIAVAMAVENVGEYNGNTLIGKITKTFSESYVSASPTLQLGSSIPDLYFYGSGATMVFKVTVGNVSTSKRLVTLNSPSSSLSANVTLSTASHFITFPLQTYMNAGESKTFMFGLTYSGTGKYKLTAGSMSITTSVDISNASTLFQHESNFGWYATMGTNPYSDYNEPLRWMPFAKKTTAGVAVTGDKTSTSLGTLNSEYQTVNYKGLLTCPNINESYYLISEYVLDTKEGLNANNCGLPYGFYEKVDYWPTKKYYDGTSWKNLTEVTANDYSTSNLRAYLNGFPDAYQSCVMESIDDGNGTFIGVVESKLNSFESQFNVKQSSLYNNIVGRSQHNLYKLTGGYMWNTNVYDIEYVEVNYLGKSTNTIDKFWPLSINEVVSFDTDRLEIGKSITSEEEVNFYSRSTQIGYDDSIFSIQDRNSSSIYRYTGCHESYGVRPAVQIACLV